VVWGEWRRFAIVVGLCSSPIVRALGVSVWLCCGCVSNWSWRQMPCLRECVAVSMRGRCDIVIGGWNVGP